MTKRVKNSDDPCVRIMHLLVQKDSKEFTEMEQEQILKHMSRCPSCRGFQEIVEEFFASSAVDPGSPLLPDPTVRKKVLARLKRMERPSESPLTILRRIMLNSLRLRIPVYQAALGMMILLTAFFVLNRRETITHLLPADRGQPYLYSQIIEEFSALYETGVNPYNTIGLSLKEDSLLFKLSVVTESDQTFQKTDSASTAQL